MLRKGSSRNCRIGTRLSFTQARAIEARKTKKLNAEEIMKHGSSGAHAIAFAALPGRLGGARRNPRFSSPLSGDPRV